MEIRQLSDIYRSVVLTIIAVLLAVIATRLPRQVTLRDVYAGRGDDIPYVRVDYVATPVSVKGVNGPVEVKGADGPLEVKLPNNVLSPLDVRVTNQPLPSFR